MMFPLLDLDQDKRDLLLNVLRWEKILGTALGFFLIAFLARFVRAFSDRMARKWTKRRLLLLRVRNLLVFAVYFLGALAVV